jgi:hypothetical protein
MRAPLLAPRVLRVFVLSMVLALGSAAGTAADFSRPPEGECALYSLPWAPSEPVYRFDDEVPEVVETFRARHGRDWILYLDPLLGTARFAAPLAPLTLLAVPEGSAELDPAAAAAAAAAFIDLNRDLFGAGAEELSPPSFQALGGGLLVVFGQRTRSGVSVRGASLRLQVARDGTLGFVKSFLGRGLSEAWEAAGLDGAALLSAEGASSSAVSGGWETLGARLELAFDEGRLDAVIPLWRLHLWQEARGMVEELRDARSGALVRSCELVKHAFGHASGVAAPLDDIFSPPQAIDEDVLQPLEGLVVTLPLPEAPPGMLPLRLLGLTAGDGSFQGTIPGDPTGPVTLVSFLA